MHFRAGSLVEVASEEEGFTHARYLATIIRPPALLTSSSSKKKSLRALVEYKTLLEVEGNPKRLRENVDPSFLRPCPPKQEVRDDYELNEVVDASHEDGWWCGIVNAVLDKSSYSVLFRDPPDQIIFKASKLRTHLDWIDSKWVHPGKKAIVEFIFNVGASVEVTPFGESSNNAWVSATVLENNGCNDIIVGYGDVNESLDGIKDINNIRPSPPALPKQNYGISDNVDAIFDSYWSSGKITCVLPGRGYMILFDHNNVEKEFTFSCLRPHIEWKEGKWYCGQSLLCTSRYKKKATRCIQISSNEEAGIQNGILGTVGDNLDDKIHSLVNSVKIQAKVLSINNESSPSGAITPSEKKSNADATRPYKKLKKDDVEGSFCGQPSTDNPKLENNNQCREAHANEAQGESREHHGTEGELKNPIVKCLQDSGIERSAEIDVEKNDGIFIKSSVMLPRRIQTSRSEHLFRRKSMGDALDKIGRGRGVEIGRGRGRGGGRRPAMSWTRNSKRLKTGHTGHVESGKPKSSRITRKELIEPLDSSMEIFGDIFVSDSVAKSQYVPSSDDDLPISKLARTPDKKASKVKKTKEVRDCIVAQTAVVNLPPCNVSEVDETKETGNDVIQPSNASQLNETLEVRDDFVGVAPLIGNLLCYNPSQVNAALKLGVDSVEEAPLIGNSPSYNVSQVNEALEIEDDFLVGTPPLANPPCFNVSQVNRTLGIGDDSVENAPPVDKSLCNNVIQVNQTLDIGDDSAENDPPVDISLCNNVIQVNQRLEIGDDSLGNAPPTDTSLCNNVIQASQTLEIGDVSVENAPLINNFCYNVSQVNQTKEIEDDFIENAPPTDDSLCCNVSRVNQTQEIGDDFIENVTPIDNSVCNNVTQVNQTKEIEDNFIENAQPIHNSLRNNVAQVNQTKEIEDDFIKNVPPIDYSLSNNVTQVNQTKEIEDVFIENAPRMDNSFCGNASQANQTNGIGDNYLEMNCNSPDNNVRQINGTMEMEDEILGQAPPVRNPSSYNASQVNLTSEMGDDSVENNASMVNDSICNNVSQLNQSKEIEEEAPPTGNLPRYNENFDEQVSVAEHIGYDVVMNNPSFQEAHGRVCIPKRSPIWEEVEAMEAFQHAPQNPHFSPLVKNQEQLREGLAIGKMLVFASLFETSAKLCVDDPITVFRSISDDLDELEHHGFSVEPLKRRLRELLLIKTRVEEFADEAKRVEAKMRENEQNRDRILEEINEFDGKVKEIEGELRKALTLKVAQECELDSLLSDMHAIKEDMEQLECEYVARAAVL